jgi:phospholipid/cholesterol/gamma-HCH transport system substrate-binding protein
MISARRGRIALGVVLTACLLVAIAFVVRGTTSGPRTALVAYFENSNGVFVGDDVMILGVTVGKIDNIEPEPLRVKITFYVDSSYKVPADARAVIISPTLVSARAIQLTPVYTDGPVMGAGTVIPQERTAVPVEFDDLRRQLDKLTEVLQPTEPGGVSTLGAFVATAADNVRGQGRNIHDAIVQLSQAVSVLGDGSGEIFGTVKNLSILVTALKSSQDLLRQLNRSLAGVTSVLSNSPDEVGAAIADLNTALKDVQGFVADNRDTLGTTGDKLASVSTAVVESLDDLKQTLHVAPTAFSNFINIYEPNDASSTGAVALTNFTSPVTFICGAVQAASRLGNEQAAKLCAQYLAPIVKNRQYNFLPPFGVNPFVGAQARPNEVTFSENWLRPLTEAGRIRDFYEGPLPGDGVPPEGPPYPAEAVPTDPSGGLLGMMTPPGGGGS